MLHHLRGNNLDKNLFNSVISYMDRIKFKFNSSFLNPDFTLVLGDTTFLNDNARQLLNKKAVFVTDKHCSLRKLPQGLLTFSRLKHTQCGGCTSFMVLYSFTPNIITIHPSQISWPLNDFLNFESKTSSIKSNDITINSYDLLLIQFTHKFVCHPTTFTLSGWGY